MSMTPEEKKARNAERMRKYREANKEDESKRVRQYREANKEKITEKNRKYSEANKEKEAERKRKYREANKGEEAERKRKYREANKEKEAERKRRSRRQKCFTRENGSSFQSWQASLYNRSAVFEVVANLTPDPGQTLAELIHELSGYSMDVCEQIANPPVIEDAPPAQPEPQPDLF